MDDRQKSRLEFEHGFDLGLRLLAVTKLGMTRSNDCPRRYVRTGDMAIGFDRFAITPPLRSTRGPDDPRTAPGETG